MQVAKAWMTGMGVCAFFLILACIVLLLMLVMGGFGLFSISFYRIFLDAGLTNGLAALMATLVIVGIVGGWIKVSLWASKKADW